jgi:ABC-type polysaccharide/polyol phosphate transport system ATPase subunit
VTDAIRMEGVGKRYWQLSEQAMLLRSLIPFARPTRKELWALRGFDLSIAQGEVVGIIGRNGAGKTTTLRMLAGVTRPTEGVVRIAGRVAPLISVGVGFHKEMSGRENIYVNGMLLGLTKAEIDERFDAIVAFAELADFIDTPVKFYSSGMFMRLGFSVAVHTDPSILLVDEVLAVGDLAFQMKCLERMKEIREAGTTIVLVSHAMPAIRLLCPRAIVVRHGQLEFDGDVETAIAKHHELLWAEADSGQERAVGDQAFVGGATVVSKELLDDGVPTHVTSGGPLRFRARVQFHRAVDSPMFVFTVRRDDSTIAYFIQTPLQLSHRSFAAGEECTVELALEPRLGGGNYRLTTVVASRDGRDLLGADESGLAFNVPARLWVQGVAELDGVVELDGAPLVDDRSWRLGAPTPEAPAG